MGTRCFIGINEDTGYLGVSCNYDGFVECAGMTLFSSYSDPDSLRKLISFGDLNALGSTVGTTEYSIGGNRFPRKYCKISELFEKEDAEYAYMLDRNGKWYYYKKTSRAKYELETDLRRLYPADFSVPGYIRF